MHVCRSAKSRFLYTPYDDIAFVVISAQHTLSSELPLSLLWESVYSGFYPTTMSQHADNDWLKPMPGELEAIKALLSDKVTPDIAAQKFTSAVASSFSSGQYEGLEGDMWRLWGIINNSVREATPDSPDIEKMVLLIAAIKRLPTLKKGPEEAYVWGMQVWSDLPIFGANMREDWNRE